MLAYRVEPSLDLIPIRVMGEHKALKNNDYSMHEALKEQKLRDEEIISYLDSENDVI
jgi:hypothetical protein